CGGQSHDVAVPEDEMICPDVLPRIEQCNHDAAVGIDTCEVRSFIRVAPIAGKRESGRIVSTAVLPRDNMFDMKRNDRRCFLRNAAILTGVAGSCRTSSRTAGSILCGLLCEELPRLRLDYRNQID